MGVISNPTKGSHVMSGAGKKIFKNSRFVIKKNKENLGLPLDSLGSHGWQITLLSATFAFLGRFVCLLQNSCV
jgi:hypothetical protein